MASAMFGEQHKAPYAPDGSLYPFDSTVAFEFFGPLVYQLVYQLYANGFGISLIYQLVRGLSVRGPSLHV
jgi:hypothetical protein